jgi:molybdopterin converting factor small subunit
MVAATLEVRVALFGAERAAYGASTITVTVPDGASCAELRAAMARAAPTLEPLLPAARFAVNHCFSTAATRLAAGDEVALIGAVSGG